MALAPPGYKIARRRWPIRKQKFKAREIRIVAFTIILWSYPALAAAGLLRLVRRSPAEGQGLGARG